MAMLLHSDTAQKNRPERKVFSMNKITIAKHKKALVVISVFILAFVIILLVSVRDNHGNADGEYMEEYIYDSSDSRYNYSEHTVLYLADSGILHMIDTASGKDMVYCDRPNCTHERPSLNNVNPSCPAVFYGHNLSAVLHNKHLYFIGNMTNEDVFKTQYLYEMDPNGQNRKIVASIDGVQSVRFVLYRDNYVIGAYCNRVEVNEDGQIINENKPEAGIFVINLDAYEVYMGEKIIGEQANITGIHYEDGAVYYSSVHFGDDVTELMVSDAAGGGTENSFESFVYDNMLFGVHRYDIASGNTALVKTLTHIHDLRLLDGDGYYVTKEGYFVLDKKSGETKELPIDINAGTLWGGFRKHENVLYYAIFDSAGNEVTYYRMENEKTDELMKLPPEKAFGIQNICGNSVYINYTDDSGRFCLGVLSIDDLNNGNFNVKELRCYNEEE